MNANVNANAKWLALLLVGCATVDPAPIRFPAPHAAVATVAQALEANGQPAERIGDDGVVVTRWLDTGVGYGFVGGHPASVLRRYVASVRDGAVSLRVELQRCARGSWDPVAAVGACELLQGVLPRDRDAWVALAEKLRRTVEPR